MKVERAILAVNAKLLNSHSFRERRTENRRSTTQKDGETTRPVLSHSAGARRLSSVETLRWKWAAATDVGRVRAKNEDCYLADGEAGVFAVADGMGGHAAGEVASQLAVRVTDERLLGCSVEADEAEKAECLRSALLEANRAIREESRAHPARAGMGTTATTLVVEANGNYAIGHVGDSRAYRLRDGLLERLTEDHTYVQQLVNRGRLTDEQARLHPRSSLLTRALGTDDHVDVDLYRGSLCPGDRLLLCSDGLTGMLSDHQLAELMGSVPDPDVLVDRLIRVANEAGGSDNITVVVVDALAEGTESPQ
jgi:protein phosphatase